MKIKYFIPAIILMCMIFSCKKEEYKVEYQKNYPNILAGNWVVFEFPVRETNTQVYDPYDMVTSLDPNMQGYLIIDKMYASDVRVRVKYDTSTFFSAMGEQLEVISTNDYNIEFISVDGYVSQNPILIDALYYLAASYFENIAFEKEDIKDVIFMHVGYYDQQRVLIDTVEIMGYRKTGFEDVNYN